MFERADPPRDAAARIRHDLVLGSGYVDVLEVLRLLDVEVYQASFAADSLDGAHTQRAGASFVFVNTANAITRQRLTAAHELGHHVLDASQDGDVVYESDVSNPGNDPAEQAAFRFARYFLMDPDGVARLTGRMKDEVERVAAVAAHFVVSPEVAAIHLVELKAIKLTTKRDLADALASKATTPSALLRRYGYRMAWTPQDRPPELDPRHMRRGLEAYEAEWITLPALADSLQMSLEETRRLLAEHGIPSHEPESA
jgi:Zn-dependent peptidase ImmA (M78 family)